MDMAPKGHDIPIQVMNVIAYPCANETCEISIQG